MLGQNQNPEASGGAKRRHSLLGFGYYAAK